MKSEPFNPVQLHLLKMFSYAKDEPPWKKYVNL